MRTTSHRSYDEAFRQDALALLEKTDRGIAEVSRDLGVPASTLLYWYYHRSVGKKPKGRPPNRPVAVGAAKETPAAKIARLERELARLQKKNDELEMDRAILKKAAAFFAKESE